MNSQRPSPSSYSAPNDMRQRVYTKDASIRKSAEQSLLKKATSSPSRKSQPQSAGRSLPISASSAPFHPVLTIHEDATVLEACRLMAARRSDAILLTGGQAKSVTGIFTDKDIAYRVVAEGLDPSLTKIAAVMTRSPVTLSSSAPLSDGLKIMVQRHFRHLPVIDDNTGAVMGLLDITQCMKESLRRLDKADKVARRLASALDSVENDAKDEAAEPLLDPAENWPGSQASAFAELLRSKLAAPTISSLLLSRSKAPPLLSYKSTVIEATRLMKLNRETAVLLVDDNKSGALVGIFTSKDVVLRVLAASLDSSTTSLVRVMTPHPDTISLDTSVLDALKKMHAGHYLHLPVLDDNQIPFGLVDVLQLTYTALEQIHAAQTGGGEAHGSPSLLHQLWPEPTFFAPHEELYDTKNAHAAALPDDQLSQHSNETGSVRGEHSHHTSSVRSGQDRPYVYKIKGPEGAIYLSFSTLDHNALVTDMKKRFCIADDVSLRVCYRDDEDDLVLIANKDDLNNAFLGLRRKTDGVAQAKLSLFVFIGGVALEEWLPLRVHAAAGPADQLASGPDGSSASLVSPHMTAIAVSLASPLATKQGVSLHDHGASETAKTAARAAAPLAARHWVVAGSMFLGIGAAAVAGVLLYYQKLRQ